jgi:hypothetical protein
MTAASSTKAGAYLRRERALVGRAGLAVDRIEAAP